jgi:hypothetical protein
MARNAIQVHRLGRGAPRPYLLTISYVAEDQKEPDHRSPLMA